MPTGLCHNMKKTQLIFYLSDTAGSVRATEAFGGWHPLSTVFSAVFPELAIVFEAVGNK